MSFDNCILESDKLVLKELKPSHVSQEYVDWLNDSEVNKYLESRFVHQNIDSVKAFVNRCLNNEFEFLFGIFIKKNLKHIGNIKIGPINQYHKYAEVGLMIGDKNSWGKGFASNAISVITEFGFNQLKLVKIKAGCYESNIGSKKAFENNGYKVEGFLENHVKSINGREGVWNMRCFLSDFNSLNSK